MVEKLAQMTAQMTPVAGGTLDVARAEPLLRDGIGQLCRPISTARTDGTIEISLTVRNTGDREGDEVVQLYLHDLIASTSRPLQELKGFARASLEAGASATVSFELAAEQLAVFNRASERVIEPGELRVLVGASSADIRLRGTFTLVGDRPTPVGPRPRLRTRVSVRPAVGSA